MIDFKYHIVSLISVFLAIALGIVIGTTALNGPIVTSLKTTVTGLKDDKRSLEARVGGLETQVNSNSEFDASLAKSIIGDKLKGQTFITITVGDVTGDERDAVIKMVQSAGGKLTGAIALTKAYSDPKQSSALLAFATTDPPAGVVFPTDTSDGGVVVSSLLATMLTDPSSGDPQPGAAITTVLGGLGSLGVLSVDGNDPSPATNFVIITGGVQPDQAAERNTILLSLGKYLSKDASVVIAGDVESATEKGLVYAARQDAAAEATLSTVDNSNVGMGQISVVLALLAQAKGTSGQYGVGDGADPTPPLPGD